MISGTFARMVQPAAPFGSASSAAVLVCVDVGSTFTKAAAIGPNGEVVALAQHPTTSGSDVLEGLDAAVASLDVGGVADVGILACSSAGGGLRLAVVGQERVISAEAGRRVALSAGARVVSVSAGQLDDGGIQQLVASAPDVVLVVGGTDGGDSEVLLHNCGALGASQLSCPVVLAGNSDAVAAGAALLRHQGGAREGGRGRTGGRAGGRGASGPAGGSRVVLATANVIPRIGALHPGPARRAIREVFISHVIGGKGLSRGPRFGDLVIAATPDAVLAGLEVVAEVLACRPGATGDVMALDVGGATTDVYSVLTPDERAPREAVETLWHGRTVEGDLGMRWSAPDVVLAARGEQLIGAPSAGPDPELDALVQAAEQRRDDVGFLPGSESEVADDLWLARAAATIAARRHGRPGPEGSRDLTHVGLLIGSGGVLRHADPPASAAVLQAVLSDVAGGWRLPERARAMLDEQYLLAPIGLLALTGRESQARSLASGLLGP